MARGAWHGGVAGGVLLGVAATAHAAGLVADRCCRAVARTPDGLLWWRVAALGLALVAAGAAVGALCGLALGRSVGVDVDDVGIHPVPRRAGELLPWRRVADVRTERRGARIVIAVDVAGVTTRLRAPYDGWFLARDPEFEEKLFMLRNLWETHRSFNLP
ncbi:hypothetical protein GCM10009682_15840 [Luedemannella flava]|uniref:Uncharacterized protein n=2 Tax=Luedemannella flava TaxID=349316 RepID=A0ABP4XZK0_9ACTN